MSDCIFCRIVRGEIPARKVYESETVTAFEDITPQAPVHVLIIPKEHISSVHDEELTKGDILKDIFKAVRETAEMKGLGNDGYRLVSNHLEKAGQSVFHLHFHMLGGRQMKWPPG